MDPAGTSGDIDHVLGPASTPHLINSNSTSNPTSSDDGRTFNPNPPRLDHGPKVPRPINFRMISPDIGNLNRKGNLKIYLPRFGVILPKPPRQNDLLPSELTFQGEDKILSGTLEVTIPEKCKVKSIQVGVQSICSLHMGVERGWEQDGIFERIVSISQGVDKHNEEDGIWLNKGTQSFSFSVLLPSTLAISDDFIWGGITHIVTAKVEGLPIPPSTLSSITSIFKPSFKSALEKDLANRAAFEEVMARSAPSAKKGDIHASSVSPNSTSNGENIIRRIDQISSGDSPAYQAEAEGSVATRTNDASSSFHYNGRGDSPSYCSSTSTGETLRGTSSKRLEGDSITWMKGDLYTSRVIMIQPNPFSDGDVTQLDIRRDTLIDGLGPIRYSLSADEFTVSCVCIFSLSFPSPSPTTTIFCVRLVISQSCSIVSPRTPDLPPYHPTKTKSKLLYQVGEMPKGHDHPGKEVPFIWKGKDVIGAKDQGQNIHVAQGEEGWKIKQVVRLPDHLNLAPSTLDGTITPIDVKHEITIQVWHSIYGENAQGEPINGPGECRSLIIKFPVLIPSCSLTVKALNLPTYETSDKASSSTEDIKEIFSSSWTKYRCMCGYSFEELGSESMRRNRDDDMDYYERRLSEGQVIKSPTT
ncbi:uncharacterized protein IL334_005321 [Kwoniella shivajii]|uniref:Arrestin C-terminal-like domain-containing protein n=1 Tax=Kwoniella shivajii TaxID=564305 RepID=A0ABZ1D4M0_9TREE|nr:hypothetical protein IL334_005321 [Kwoniella shivajii]